MKFLGKPFVKIIITLVLVIGLAEIGSYFGNVIRWLDVIQFGFQDFDFTDIYYSSKPTTDQELESEIVIVDIESYSRADLAVMLRKVDQYQPAVVGLLFFMRQLKNDSSDRLMRSAIQSMRSPLVFVSDIDRNGGVSYSHPEFIRDHPSGYNQFYGDAFQESLYTVRGLYKNHRHQDTVYHPFAYEVAKVYSPQKAVEFAKRKHFEEVINYKGGSQFNRREVPRYFYSLKRGDLITDNIIPSFLQGKIVLFGALHEGDPYQIEDQYYTPMNSVVLGHSRPDMSAVEIHANIISMIISGTYINYSKTLDTAASMLAVLITILGCLVLLKWKPAAYQLASKALVFIMLNVLVAISVTLFIESQFKLDLRMGMFYLLFVSDVFEFVQKNKYFRPKATE